MSTTIRHACLAQHRDHVEKMSEVERQDAGHADGKMNNMSLSYEHDPNNSPHSLSQADKELGKGQIFA